MTRVQVDEQQGPLVIVDRLTAEPLEVPITLVRAQGSRTFQAGEIVDLSPIGPEVLVQFTVPEEKEPRSVTMADSAHWDGVSWSLRLPYFAALDVQVEGPLEGLEAGAAVVTLYPNSRVVEPEEAGEDAGPSPGLSRFAREVRVMKRNHPLLSDRSDTTLAGLMRWTLRSKGAEALASKVYSHGRANRLLSDRSGPVVAGWVDRSGCSSFVEAVLIPGEVTVVRIPFQPRPLLRGRLIDWEGNPVPHGVLSLSTALDLHDYDLSPSDPHGTILYVREQFPHHTARRDVRTDEEGRFSFRVPRGTGYAIETRALGSYSFWSCDHVSLLVTGGEEILLELADPAEERWPTVTFLSQDGSPMASGRIAYAVPGDVPFFRQHAEKVSLDQEGAIRLVGLEPGTQLGFFLFDSSLKGGSFAPPIVTLPSSGGVEIRVPESALLDAGG